MAKRIRDTKAILQTITRSGRRSSLFWWMVEHHDEMLAAAKCEPIDWAGFCVEAGQRGLTDTKGKVPTERNARETWRQARRVVADARAREAGKPPPRPGSVYPSRIPKDWRPAAFRAAGTTAVVPARGSRAQVVAKGAEGLGAADEPEELNEHAKKQFADLDESLERYDRRFRFGGG